MAGVIAVWVCLAPALATVTAERAGASVVAQVASGEPPATTSTGTTVPTTTVGDAPTAISPDGSPGEDKPGFFDIGGRVRQSINDWFRGLVADSLGPVLDLLAESVFSTPDVSRAGRTRDVWLVSMALANAMFVIVVTVGGFVLMGNESVQSQYTLRELLPRVVVGWFGANLSLWIVGNLIRLANAVSGVFLMQGATSKATAMEGMKSLALEPLGQAGGLPLVLLLLVVVVLAIGVIAGWIIRVANIVVLAMAGPLLLAAYALPRGEGAARLWWRALVGCLLIQVAQSLLLATALRILFDADGRRAMGLPGGPYMDVLLIGCLFFALLQIPAYAGRLIFAARPSHIARYYVISRGVRQVVGAGR